MTAEERLRSSLAALEVNEDFTEAIVFLHDGSKLHFCHRVDERWLRAVVSDAVGTRPTCAADLLAQVRTFRLNAKHLDVQFNDASGWEARFRDGMAHP
jgi:hypothetical protein